MREHVLELLRRWEAGEIPRRRAPEIPVEVAERGFGGVSLGQWTQLAKERADRRRRMYERWMADATSNPERLSPFIMIDKAAQMRDSTLVGRKLEVRWLMEAEGEGEGEGQSTFVHCFEGTVRKVVPYGAGRKKALGLDFGARVPVALVEWDPEFDWPPAYVPLDLELYAKEDRHYGWNVLADEYTRAWGQTAPAGSGSADDAGSGDEVTDSDSTDDGSSTSGAGESESEGSS